MNISRDLAIFSSHLSRGAEKLSIDLSQEKLSAMVCHAEELMKWNEKMNLTAIKDPADMAEKHFLDAVCAGRFLGRETRFVDLGPGAGFPSIPLKIMNPSLEFSLVDSARKKTSFLNHLIRQLGLKDIKAVHTRIQDFPTPGVGVSSMGNFQPQAIITRGVAHLETLADLVQPLIFPSGTLYALKGEQVQEEISADLEAKYHIQADKYILPFTRAVRYLVTLKDKKGPGYKPVIQSP